MNHQKPDIVIMAELDWGGLHCQSHVMAKGFAGEGHRVYYINRTLQRWPRLHHLLTRLRPSPARGVQKITPVPEGIQVINLWVGPPVRWLRIINRWLIRYGLGKFTFHAPVLLTYIPTYNCIDVMKEVKAKFLAYVCYHNFDADIVLRDLLRSEREIIRNADLLFADSRYLVERLRRISGNKEVFQAPPGVYFDEFSLAYRGDETVRLKKICFFGGAGKHLDLKTYNRLCDRYEVHFIAVINPEIANELDPRIRISEPVSNHELPALLREMDVLTILYRQSPYIDAVLPAKFFECLATGKPLLVSGLNEMKYYSEYVYETGNDPEQALTLLKHMPESHTPERVQKQFELGRSSDFKIRYKEMAGLIRSRYEAIVNQHPIQ